MQLTRRRFTTWAGAALLSTADLASRAAIGGTRMAEISVLELRQYTLFGGKRDTLIELFEREFVESQDAVGAQVVGTFRDLDDPDRFVWLRGFSEMEARKRALETFYKGSAWRAHGPAANVTMVDSGNVLLLKPHPPGAVLFETLEAKRADAGVYAARIYALNDVAPATFARFFEGTLKPLLRSLNVMPVAELITEARPNTVPALPVRENAPVFVWFGRWPDETSERQFAAAFARRSGWRDQVPKEVLPALMSKPECLRLAPTRRSKLQ